MTMAGAKSECNKAKKKGKPRGRPFKPGHQTGRLGRGIPRPNQARTIADVQQAFIRSTVDIDDRLEQLKREDNATYLRIIAGLTVKLQEQATPRRVEISFVTRGPVAAPAGGNGRGG